MYASSLSVGAWVAVRDTCPMRHRINASDDVEFAFGTGTTTFEFVFGRGALREFISLATVALLELDAIDTREHAATEPGRLGHQHTEVTSDADNQ